MQKGPLLFLWSLVDAERRVTVFGMLSRILEKRSKSRGLVPESQLNPMSWSFQ